MRWSACITRRSRGTLGRPRYLPGPADTREGIAVGWTQGTTPVATRAACWRYSVRMSVKTITENGRQLTVQTLQKVDPLGVTYWQGRAMFRIADGRARADVVTRTRYATRESAENAAIALARANGWVDLTTST